VTQYFATRARAGVATVGADCSAGLEDKTRPTADDCAPSRYTAPSHATHADIVNVLTTVVRDRIIGI
jgi:hypothetical protein